MTSLKAIYRGLIALFVDDGLLALAILAVVALAGAVATFTPELLLQAGAILLFGCLGVLIGSVLRAARR
jgi:hypothetical protein